MNTIKQTGNILNFHQVITGSGGRRGERNVNLDVNGSALLSGGRVVGALTEDLIIFSILANEDYGDTYSVSLLLNTDGTANFEDRFNYSGDPRDYDSLSGVLSHFNFLPVR